MNLDTIKLDRSAAREAFMDYRKAFRQQHAEIDGELMRGYKALAGGSQLIRLSSTIQAGGADSLGRPKLAIARADERRISFERSRNGAVTFTPNIDWGQRARAGDRVIALGEGTLPSSADPDGWISNGAWQAILPIIPPKFRPPYGLDNYHLLWEAVWTRGARRAPGDPALLKRIGGDLFAVLAIWDLSPLEKAVLEVRG